MENHESFSSTPYDDVFRTMMAKGGDLRISFINEMFHLKNPLPKDTPIENIANEYFDKYLLLTDMLKKVTHHLLRNYKTVRKELDDIMSGKVLTFKGEDIYNEGRAEGITEGKINDLLSLVYDGVLTEEFAAARAEKRYGVKKDKFKQLLSEYIPDDDEKLQG